MRQRIIMLVVLLLMTILLKGQTIIGNEVAVQVKNSSWGGTQNALVSLPDDYYTTTRKYPLIIFYHGYGEIGSSTTDLNKLTKQGLPAIIASGVKIQAINPVDKQLYKFIVISPQHWGWTTTPDQMNYMLKDILSKYRVDEDRIYHTGLSAGGQGTIQMTTYSQTLSNTIAAIVPMSPAATSTPYIKNFKFFKESKTAAWFFSGDKDNGPYTKNARAYSDSINKYNPGSSKVTLYSGGHCCWTTVYNPSYRVNGMNIYEWMLQYKKGGPIVEPPVIDPNILDTISVGTNKIILYKDNTWKYLN